MTTTTPEVVEAVAKALFKDDCGDIDCAWEEIGKDGMNFYRRQAEAAIAEYIRQTGMELPKENA